MLKAYADGRRASGGFTTWYSYKNIRVQGTYELRVCRILDEWLNRGLIAGWEYTDTRIKYRWSDGSVHTYLVDFRIERLNGSCFFVETKGFVRPHDEEKWKAFRALRNELLIWFDADIRREEFAVGLPDPPLTNSRSIRGVGRPRLPVTEKITDSNSVWTAILEAKL